MREPRYLFDASSIVRALREAKLVPLGGQAIQWLTVYEVINALWKEAYLLRRLGVSEASSLVNVFTELVEEMVVLEPSGLEQEVFRIAISRGLTVYDASYVALAVKHGLILVTEDKKLSSKAGNIVKVMSFDSLSPSTP